MKDSFKIAQNNCNLMSGTYKWRHLNGTISGDGYIYVTIGDITANVYSSFQ